MNVFSISSQSFSCEFKRHLIAFTVFRYMVDMNTTNIIFLINNNLLLLLLLSKKNDDEYLISLFVVVGDANVYYRT